MKRTEKRINRRELFQILTGRGAKPFFPPLKKGGRGDFLHPPGAVEERQFWTLCDGCGRCAEACPYGSIKMNDVAIIVPKESPCYLCQDFPCIDACKTGALRPVEGIAKVRIGTAIINRRECLAWDFGDCRLCFIKCPLSDAVAREAEQSAIYLEDFKPVVREERCTGCGICEYICSTVNDRTPMRVVPLTSAGASRSR